MRMRREYDHFVARSRTDDLRPLEVGRGVLAARDAALVTALRPEIDRDEERRRASAGMLRDPHDPADGDTELLQPVRELHGSERSERRARGHDCPLAMGTQPIPDEAAARDLGVALRELDYTESTISELLGDDAYASGPEEIPVHERRLPPTPIATVIRLLFLGVPVSAAEATRALGHRGVEALARTGLADVGGEAKPHARLLPIGDVLLAADTYSRGVDDPADYVAAYTPTTHLCDSLTVRRRVARAADVGTGSGAHALLAARHARRVVATDVNPRALAYTQLNAALNGFANVECRAGSLFEPLADETFDLITCNAPYVVSPERRWAYRDAGGEADEISERVVRDTAAHLADGGFATALVSWIADDEDAPDERVMAWVEATGCESWILVASESTALEHAAMWNAHLADDAVAYGRALDDWTRYLDGLGVSLVSDGAIVLHRGPNGRATTRIDSVDEDTLEDASDQVERAFEARARLAALTRPADLLHARPVLQFAVRLEQDLDPPRRSTAAVSLAEGTNSIVETTPAALEIVPELDGRVRLADVVRAVARRRRLPKTQADALRRDALELTRELLELGVLSLK
jgi:methylase of polypeptide subunit release factors